ncbi:MAG: DUF3467 domain-containing protein [Planctomycetota bacterium]
MAETTPPNQPAGNESDQKREVTLRFDESDMKTSYANTIRSSSTLDEVILDFGMNMPTPGRQNEVVFKVRSQVILNWRGAKRLALTLSNLVRQHEESFGEIELQPRPRGGSGGGNEPPTSGG